MAWRWPQASASLGFGHPGDRWVMAFTNAPLSSLMQIPTPKHLWSLNKAASTMNLRNPREGLHHVAGIWIFETVGVLECLRACCHSCRSCIGRETEILGLVSKFSHNFSFLCFHIHQSIIANFCWCCDGRICRTLKMRSFVFSAWSTSSETRSLLNLLSLMAAKENVIFDRPQGILHSNNWYLLQENI